VFVSKYSATAYSKLLLPAASTRPFAGRVFGGVPERGDVAVFRLPRDPSDRLHQADRGPAGRSSMQMVDGVLHINGQPVEAAAGRGRFRYGRRI
jgi:signal peptidase I